MQEPSIYSQINQPQFPEQEILKCPRCESLNTKFCYYNNYNLSQPRHFCKSCKRYWTKGGTLRKIPVGGGSRKHTKRSPNNNNKRYSTTSTSAVRPAVPAFDQSSPILDVNGPFSSLSTSNGPEFGNLLGRESSSSGLVSGQDDIPQSGNKYYTDEYLGVQNDGDSSYWNGNDGWPDLAFHK